MGVIRGSLGSTAANCGSELVKDIDEYVAHRNKEPKAFICTIGARATSCKGHSREHSPKSQTKHNTTRDAPPSVECHGQRPEKGALA